MNVFFLCARCDHCSRLTAQHNVSLRGAAEWSTATQATVRAAICAEETRGPNKLKTPGKKHTGENVLFNHLVVFLYHLSTMAIASAFSLT